MKRMRSTFLALVALACVAPAVAGPFEDAQRDLWEARYAYRFEFVEPAGQFQGDYDRLRLNWSTAETFDLREVLLRARNDFLEIADQERTQRAREFAAEAINEVMSGQLSYGNTILIDALKARYPFIDPANPGTGDPSRPASDTWALETNGSLDGEVVEIDKALIQFGIGLNAATTILDRGDALLDPKTGAGVLRSADPMHTYPDYPYFIQLNDGFRDPLVLADPSRTAEEAIVEPRSNPVRVEFALLASIAERRAEAIYEKGAKYFQLSGTKTEQERQEDRRKAREALKVGHHSSYLLAASMAALQPADDFASNEGAKVVAFTTQMSELYGKLNDPNFQPGGQTDQFIPPVDKPIALYISDARDAVQSAIAAEQTYRAERRDNNRRQQELEEFYLQEDEFLDRLRLMTGFTENEITSIYGRLLTIDDQRAFRAELERRVGGILENPYEPGVTPNVTCPGGVGIACLGEFGVQILNVLDAQFRIQEAFNTLQNIPRRMQIEQDRSAQVIKIIYDSLGAINATEEALAWASSFSLSATATIGAPPSFSAGVAFNPLSFVVAELQRTQNTIRAHEQAGIEGANSAATVRTILLDMDNAIIELQRAKVLFDQENTKLGLLYAEMNKLMEDYSEAVELRLNNAQLHYQNPEYRRWLNESFKIAEARRQEAVTRLFQLGRALSFWWGEQYSNPIFNGQGQTSLGLGRYNSENFPDLNSVFSIITANQCGDFYLLLEEWDDTMRAVRAPAHQLTQTRTYSLRDDIVFKDLNDAGVPLNRRISDFREYLAANAYFAPGSTATTKPGIRLEFPVSLENLDARQDWNIRVAYLGNYPDGVEAGLRIDFETDADFNGAEPDAQIDVTYFGVIATTSFFDDPELSKREIVKWNIPAPGSPFAENRDELASSIPARINGRTRPGTSYLSTTFRGKPIAASNWRLTLDTTRVVNRNVDITKIRDIKIRITESRGRPVDPVTGVAYDFPGL